MTAETKGKHENALTTDRTDVVFGWCDTSVSLAFVPATHRMFISDLMEVTVGETFGD